MSRHTMFALALLATACQSDFAPGTITAPAFTVDAGGAPVAWVNGSYHRPSSTREDDNPDPELLQSATFEARLSGDGSVVGTVRLRFHRPDGTLVIDLHEEVTCLVVEEPTAWIGTVAIREQLSEGQPSRLGRPVVWQVRDLGVGDDRAQRLIDSPDCHARPELPLVAALNGDLRIVDRR